MTTTEPTETEQSPAFVIYTDQSVRDHHGVQLIQTTPELLGRLAEIAREQNPQLVEGDLRLWATYGDVKALIEAGGATVLEFRNPEAAGL